MNRVFMSLLMAGCLALAGCPTGGPGNDVGNGDGPVESSIRMVDASGPAGLELVQVGGGPEVDFIIDSVGPGGAWLDYDGDGDPDLYLAQGATRANPTEGPRDRLFRNDGDPDGDGVPAFTDVTAEAGLGDTLWSFGVSAADFDNDGDTDIHLANWGPNRLYRNDGDGSFTEIAEAAGVADRGWGTSSAWSDVDGDGDLDLYVANYVEFDFARYPARGEIPGSGGTPCVWRDLEIFCGPRNLIPQGDLLFRNDGDADGDGVPVFTDITDAAGLGLADPLYALAVRFFDADNDGDDDLYVANDSVMNSYFVNRGDGTFEEVGVFSGVAFNEQGHEQAGMGIAVGDSDGDGMLDLAVTNFSHDHDTLYRNEGGEMFTDISYRAGIGSASFLKLGWGIAFVDLDLDGFEDLFVAYGHVYPQIDEREIGSSFRQTNEVYRNAGGVFEPLGPRAGPGLSIEKSSRALLPVDLDGDGDLDVLLTNLNDRPDLLLNESAPGNWLQIRLVGGRSNRDGIGARVTLRSDGRRQIREIRRSAGFGGSVLPIAHFGLGPSTVVEWLEVAWPSGSRTVIENTEANRLLTLTEE